MGYQIADLSRLANERANADSLVAYGSMGVAGYTSAYVLLDKDFMADWDVRHTPKILGYITGLCLSPTLADDLISALSENFHSKSAIEQVAILGNIISNSTPAVDQIFSFSTFTKIGTYGAAFLYRTRDQLKKIQDAGD